MKRVLVTIAAMTLTAPAFAQSAATTAPQPAAQPKAYGKTDGLIPNVLFGPRLSIVNVPMPSIGLEVKAFNLFGASFDYGILTDITVSSATLSIDNWHVGAKVYPFQGSFFLGARLGKRTIKATYTETRLGASVTGSAEVDSTYLGPELGWRWVWDSGFFMGLDLGWQFSMSSSKTESPTVNLLSPDNQSKLRDAEDYGRWLLPSLGLLQVGFFL